MAGVNGVSLGVANKGVDGGSGKVPPTQQETKVPSEQEVRLELDRICKASPSACRGLLGRQNAKFQEERHVRGDD